MSFVKEYFFIGLLIFALFMLLVADSSNDAKYEKECRGKGGIPSSGLFDNNCAFPPETNTGVTK